MPDKGPSAKTPSPSKNSPMGLCRGFLVLCRGPEHASPVVIRLYGISVFILKLLEIKLGSPLEGMLHVLFFVCLERFQFNIMGS